jgi:hypothetical protein
MAISSNATGLHKCPSCQTEQPKTNFTIRKCGKRASYCKPCTAKKSALYRLNNREKYLESKKGTYQKWKKQNGAKAIRKNWDNLSLGKQKEIQCGIYCITIGPKFYIGSCINFPKRMADHTRKLGYGTHINAYMQSSFDKYQTFDAEIMEFCSPSELESREQFYIDQWFDYDDCLNLRPDVKTMLGFKHSEETKQKLSVIVSTYQQEIRSGNK